MKFILTILTFSLLSMTAQLSFAQMQDRPMGPGRGGDPRDGNGFDRGHRPPPPADPVTVVYRLYNGTDHMLSLVSTEGNQVGYSLEGVAFDLFSNPDRDLVPLFRCVISGTSSHFASTDAACEGQTTESILGYMGAQGSDRTPSAIYRCYNGTDHLITLDSSECTNNAYNIESVLGYAAR